MTTTNFIKLLVLLLFYCFGEGLSLSYQKKHEVQKLLKKFNKSPIKSIKSPDGDIIDCVHILRQPAFDHPLLKNHTVQLMPNYHPEGISGESKLVSSLLNTGGKIAKFSQIWQLKGKCPKGTIPIRRTKSGDVLKASSIHSYGKKTKIKDTKETVTKLSKSAEPTNAVGQSGHQYAITYVKGEKYYGAKATMNVWQPTVEHPNEFSLSQLWILAGSFDSDLNSIEAGWQVSPNLYGDNNTRLFSYWTNDAYQATGCYNHLCSGFVQISNDIAMGAAISPVSSFAADSQYEITILIWKDPKEGNWWLQFGKDTVVGYWPDSLFSHLRDTASMIEWGGEVVNSQSEQGQHTSTQMGSGAFPDQGYGKASFFNKIQVMDGSNNLIPPKGLATFTDQPNCYDVLLGKNYEWGDYFYYGGAGRNPKCP